MAQASQAGQVLPHLGVGDAQRVSQLAARYLADTVALKEFEVTQIQAEAVDTRAGQADLRSGDLPMAGGAFARHGPSRFRGRVLVVSGAISPSSSLVLPAGSIKRTAKSRRSRRSRGLDGLPRRPLACGSRRFSLRHLAKMEKMGTMKKRRRPRLLAESPP